MSNLNNLSFDSLLRVEHIALKSSSAFSVGAFAVKTITIPHNLGYSPYFKLFYTFVDNKYFAGFAGPGSFNIDGNSMQLDNINVDSTNLYVVVDNSGAGTITGTLYYRIYAEPQA